MVIIGKVRKCPKVAPCDLWKWLTESVFFSENKILIFKKSEKIQKNGKNSRKNKNEAGAMYCLIYIFFRFYC